MDGTRRINKEYYDEIDAEMGLLEQPTIGDALDAMTRKGNEPYIKEWSYIDAPDAIEKPLADGSEVHDFGHLCTRLGHTPQQEQCTAVFDIGFNGFDAHETGQLSSIISTAQDNYQKFYRCYYKDDSAPVVPKTSARDTAIYLAAGLYLRQKFSAFAAAGMAQQPYEKQRAFCVDYATKDERPSPFVGKSVITNFTRYPYDLVKLSPEEWRAITAVATGLRTPEHTPYKERLEPIRDILVESGLALNLRDISSRKLGTSKAETLAERWHHPTDRSR